MPEVTLFAIMDTSIDFSDIGVLLSNVAIHLVRDIQMSSS